MSCVVPGSCHDYEMVAMSEQQQCGLQVCENNRIRRIAGIKTVERRRMKDLREVVTLHSW